MSPSARGARLVRDSTLALVGRLAAITLSLVLAFGLLRLLGPDLYGAWSLLAVILTATSVLDLGLPGAVEREVAQSAGRGEPARAGAAVTAALGLLLGATLVTELGVAAWSAVSDAATENVRRGALYVPAAFGVALMAMVCGAALTGLQRFVAYHVWRVAGLAAGTGLTLWLAWTGVTRLDLLVIGYAVGSAVTMVGCWIHLRRAWPQMSFPFPDQAATAALLNVGGALQTASLAPLLGDYAFRLIVATRFGAASAGIYDIAARVSIVVRSLAGALASSLVPHSVALIEADDVSRVQRLHRTAVGALALLTMPATALALLLATPMADALMTPFADGATLQATIAPLLVAHMCASLALPALMIGRAAKRPWSEAAGAVVGGVLGVAGALVLPSLPTAAAWLWCIHAAALSCAWWWLSRRLPVGDVDARHLVHVAGSSLVALLVGGVLHYVTEGFPAVVAGAAAGFATFVALVTIADLVPSELRRALRALATQR